MYDVHSVPVNVMSFHSNDSCSWTALDDYAHLELKVSTV